MSKARLNRDEVEAWWALIIRIVAGILGMVIVTILSLSGSSLIPAYVVGAGMMGPTVVPWIVTAASAFKPTAPGGGNGQ